jgi:hypothetical protein
MYRITSQIFIPSLSLAIEYQGEGHFTQLTAYGELAEHQRRDNQKRILSQEYGITLIEIPYWWPKTLESLCATISHYRPDIPLPAAKSIPTLPTDKAVRSLTFIIPTSPLPLQNQNVTNWWMTEKFDGIRVFWDGDKSLWTCDKKKIPIPQLLSSTFPNVPFEGELWLGYNTRHLAERLIASPQEVLHVVIKHNAIGIVDKS